MTEALAETGTPEKTALRVGFIPITCATPIIMAHPMGFYKKNGLDVEVVKTAGSAAAALDAKPQALVRARAALADFMKEYKRTNG